MAVSNNGKWLYVGGKSGTIKVVDIELREVKEFGLDYKAPSKGFKIFLGGGNSIFLSFGISINWDFCEVLEFFEFF